MAYAYCSLSDLRCDGSISYQDRQSESGDGHQCCQYFVLYARKEVELVQNEDILLALFGVICEKVLRNLEGFLNSQRS